MRQRQVFLALLLALSFGVLWSLDLGRFIGFEQLKAHQAELTAWRLQQPLTAAALFFAGYVLATALSVPGALIITLAGGAVFGLGWGLLIVSFASTLGATLAFWVSRFLLRDWVESRWGERLAEIQSGVDKEGAYYLLTLRLMPCLLYTSDAADE
jgi:uncharacterized membrane protein YdjX (TVP38/TMEM64 family)